MIWKTHRYVGRRIARAVRTKGTDRARHKYAQVVLFGQFNDIVQTFDVDPAACSNANKA